MCPRLRMIQVPPSYSRTMSKEIRALAAGGASVDDVANQIQRKA
jgi:hypothetical protein